MKLILIADTHGRYPDIPKGDVLIFAGDWSSHIGSLKQTKMFAEYMGDAPCKRKIVIAGNHDHTMSKYGRLARKTFDWHKVEYLEDYGTYVGGLGNYPGLYIYGSPWSPETINAWVFDLARKDLAAVWSMIPQYTDILVTHGPPEGILDKTSIDHGNENAGDSALLERVREVKPLLHVFGHIHEGYGSIRKDDTIFANASFVDEHYTPRNEPIEIDIPYVTDKGWKADAAGG